MTNISQFGLTYAETDVTAYSDGVINFTLGHPSAEIEITGPVSNTASTGSHTVFSAANGNQTPYTLTIQVGIRAAPTTGDPEFELASGYITSSYRVNGDGTYSARLVPGIATAPAWGTV